MLHRCGLHSNGNTMSVLVNKRENMTFNHLKHFTLQHCAHEAVQHVSF